MIEASENDMGEKYQIRLDGNRLAWYNPDGNLS